MALKTPISILEELIVSKREVPAKYEFESIGNQLNPEFRCTVTALSVTVSENARNKKEAKQRAAASVLEQICNNIEISVVKYPSSNLSSTVPTLESNISVESLEYYTQGVNYIGLLNEYAAKNKCLTAVRYIDSLIRADMFRVSCIFGTLTTVGHGRTKKHAKQVAACGMIKDLEQTEYIPVICETPKKEEFVDTLSSKAISKFQELSISGVVNTKKIVETPSLDITNKKYTIEEVRDMLEKHHLNFEVEVIQKNPYLVVVHVDGLIHTLGMGDSEQVATEKAMNDTLIKINAKSLVEEN